MADKIATLGYINDKGWNISSEYGNTWCPPAGSLPANIYNKSVSYATNQLVLEKDIDEARSEFWFWTNMATYESRVFHSMASMCNDMTNWEKAGYWSTNRAIPNSYSLCRVFFSLKSLKIFTFRVWYGGETNYDYGYFSKVDYALYRSPSADSDSWILHKFNGSSGSSGITVTMTIPAGFHWFEIKYRKDGSSDSGIDRLLWEMIDNAGVEEQVPERKDPYNSPGAMYSRNEDPYWSFTKDGTLRKLSYERLVVVDGWAVSNPMHPDCDRGSYTYVWEDSNFPLDALNNKYNGTNDIKATYVNDEYVRISGTNNPYDRSFPPFPPYGTQDPSKVIIFALAHPNDALVNCNFPTPINASSLTSDTFANYGNWKSNIKLQELFIKTGSYLLYL